jgi:hypothetical protein
MADRSRDQTIGCFAASNLSGRPSQRLSTTKRSLVARLPWAHRTRLQQLLHLLVTNNVSNKSGNLLFAQRYLEWIENVGFWHSFGTGDAPAFAAASEPLSETMFIGTLAQYPFTKA